MHYVHQPSSCVHKSQLSDLIWGHAYRNKNCSVIWDIRTTLSWLWSQWEAGEDGTRDSGTGIWPLLGPPGLGGRSSWLPRSGHIKRTSLFWAALFERYLPVFWNFSVASRDTVSEVSGHDVSSPLRYFDKGTRRVDGKEENVRPNSVIEYTDYWHCTVHTVQTLIQNWLHMHFEGIILNGYICICIWHLTYFLRITVTVINLWNVSEMKIFLQTRL